MHHEPGCQPDLAAMEGRGAIPLMVRLATGQDLPRSDFPRRERTVQVFSTCPYSSSTGVARPKIETATLSREKGGDIDAACGQLRLKTERELAAQPVAAESDEPLGLA